MVSMYNSEGYKDPVVYEALTRVEAEERAARAAAAYRPLVYICSPYAGDIEKNTYRARAFSRFAVEKKYIPIAPHLLCPQYLDEETEEGDGPSGDGRVNINTASKEELMSLPGIGESRAEDILAWRSKSRFEKPEDIMNVPGIKEGAFRKLEGRIRTK